jgi:hypothetical protein
MAFEYALLFLLAIAMMVWTLWRWSMATRKSGGEQTLAESKDPDPYYNLEPLENFDWSTTEPIKIRPFKPKYHLTMGQTPRATLQAQYLADNQQHWRLVRWRN